MIDRFLGVIIFGGLMVSAVFLLIAAYEHELYIMMVPALVLGTIGGVKMLNEAVAPEDEWL